ncbi:MAG: DUF1467 family protein [Bauldia sp.]
MSLVSLAAIYFVVWWVVLFAVLPWGVRAQEEEGEVVPGSMPGAPARPRLVGKVIATSIVAAAVVGLFWLATDVYGLDVRTLAEWSRFGR